MSPVLENLHCLGGDERADTAYSLAQPIGTGFSYGTDPVTSTVSAAEYVWIFLQNFYVAFPDYESRDFGLWTESYGGHYGPEFAAYFESQNAAIDAGTVDGEKINLVAVGRDNPISVSAGVGRPSSY